MAKNDLTVRKGSIGVFELRSQDQSTASNRSATLKPGEPVKTAGTNFVDIVGTGDPEIGTDVFMGVVANESTDDSSNNGRVLVDVVALGGAMIRGKVNNSANLTSQSDLDGLLQKFVTFDVDGSNNITIDEDETSDPNVHGLFIIGGDPDLNELDVIVTGSTAFESTV